MDEGFKLYLMFCIFRTLISFLKLFDKQEDRNTCKGGHSKDGGDNIEDIVSNVNIEDLFDDKSRQRRVVFVTVTAAFDDSEKF